MCGSTTGKFLAGDEPFFSGEGVSPLPNPEFHLNRIGVFFKATESLSILPKGKRGSEQARLKALVVVSTCRDTVSPVVHPPPTIALLVDPYDLCCVPLCLVQLIDERRTDLHYLVRAADLLCITGDSNTDRRQS